MSQVKQIKDAVDIVDVIGQRLELKQVGSSYRALCPFHSEKSPSFFVNPHLQRYRCFGCGARGDVLEFLQQYEGMSFYEALQSLADQAGIELKQYSKTQDDEAREKIQEILSASVKYYHYLLTEHKAGEVARKYLKERGISFSSIELFNLGYALPAWDGLLNYLSHKKKFDPDLILKSGMIIRNTTGRYYDRFRGRVMFPLKNHRGQVVGFSGRLIENDNEKDKQQPKYINTPETILYHKASTLFGYSELFQQIRKKKEVIVCEGEFDVISSHQAHVSHIVAIKGSALTAQQAKLLERTVEKVIITLDSDEAGIKATRRAIQVVGETNLDLRVIDLSAIPGNEKAQDVDDLVRKNSAQWRDVSKKSVSAYEFLIDVAFRNHDFNTAVGRRKIIDELAGLIKNIPHEVEKDFYIRRLADKLSVSVTTLVKDIEKFGQSESVSSNKTSSNSQTTNNEDQDSLTLLQEYLLYLLFNSPDDLVLKNAEKLRGLGFWDGPAKYLLEALKNFKNDYSLSGFAETLAEDLKATLMDWYHHPDYSLDEQGSIWEKEWKKSLKKYERLLISNQIQKINKKISQLEREADGQTLDLQSKTEEKINDYLAQIAKLQGKLRVLLTDDL
ncbi:MAG: DNA primase [Microgenomates bacterium 39_7]|nr:MAG: DNA primase [Microgenomates bacterium 39_7]